MVLLLINKSLTAQSGSQVYRHITSRDGLSNSFVWEMMQDRHGFVWIAGNNGLDRYDGYNVTSFRNDPNNESSITAGAVFRLFEDQNGYIWIGTGMGLSIFNPAAETFFQIQTPDSLPAPRGVRGITPARDGFVWVSGADGLYRFAADTPEAGTPRVEFYGFDDSMENPPFIQTIEEDMDGEIWIGSDQGLFHFDVESGRYEKQGPFEEPLERVLTSPGWKILKDSSHSMWITTEFGLVVWRNGANAPELITTLGNGAVDLTDAYMQSIFEDNEGILWFGTGEIGAFSYNPETEDVKTFRHDDVSQNSITEDDIHYIFKDIDDNVWFGYHNVGISVMYTQPWQYRFITLTETPDFTHPLNDIHHVVDDEDGNLWLAAHHGIVKKDGDTNEIVSYLPDPQNTSDDNPENQLGWFLYDQDRFLANTHANKVYSFSIESEQFTEIVIPDSITLTNMNAISDTHYYLGTFQDGNLLQIDKQSLKINIIEAPRREPDNSENRAVQPFVGPEGNIYVKYSYAEAQNFNWDYFLFHPDNESFTPINLQAPEGISIFRQPLLSLTEEGVFWVVTNRGLLREDVINIESTFLFQNDAGIIADSGFDILEDNEGYFWLGGSNGIIKLDPATEVLTIFEADPARKPSIFRSPVQVKNGDIVYSGIGGYVRFNPNQQLEDPTIQYIHITELRSGADTYSTINSGGDYEIDSANNNISFTYLAMNYRTPATTRYRYRLIGHHEEWTEVGTQRSVFLANLPPGGYTFQVQAAQRFGGFSENTAEISLSILPPWWQTIPAYIGFFMLFIGGVVAADRVQRKRVIRKERERSREKELEQAKEIEKAYENLKDAQEQLVQQEKLASLGQLTAGIAHEIKNPLNFVNNFSDLSIELVEEAREEVKRETADDKCKKSPFEGGAGVPDGTKVGDGHGNNHNLILEILNDIESNLRKIHEHGSRADSIVKSMLQHSRGGNNVMEPTDINALIKEYANLAFHGMRAGKDPINVDIELDLDNTVGEIDLIAEDFSRVILNMCNNAFDAMREKANGKRETADSPFEGGKDGEAGQGDDSLAEYEPKLTVRTHKKDQTVTIEIEDNGPGIPDEIKDKILQPFFTTKKGTEGTGLGLSITNDIIKAHGGVLEIHSKEKGTNMTVTLNQL